MNRCKHDNGWSLKENTHAYIFPDGFVEFDFTRRNKLVFRCNNPDCKAERNVYLKSTAKMGKIRFTGEIRV